MDRSEAAAARQREIVRLIAECLAEAIRREYSGDPGGQGVVPEDPDGDEDGPPDPGEFSFKVR